MILQTQVSEVSRDSKVVDSSVQLIYFVFTNLELKNINFKAPFRGILFGDHLRSDEWKHLNRRNILRLPK